MEPIQSILMRRDGMTAEEAEDLVSEAREELERRLEEDEDAYDICEEYFGLEPDYISQLI
jgi:hypothetical protein